MKCYAASIAAIGMHSHHAQRAVAENLEGAVEKIHEYAAEYVRKTYPPGTKYTIHVVGDEGFYAEELEPVTLQLTPKFVFF